ncbi:MAG: NmrA family NAD(P)-binding protein [Nitrospirae bacterium]|nr:NmrA family NAD(P)-binding protein [Nitrospirota bacterium]
MYAITGATGNTGKLIAEALLSKGKKVRVIGRDAARLKPLVDKGAEPFAGSLDDAAALTRAFTGTKAVYAIIPPNPTATNLRDYQNKIGEALATAIANARVQHVVNLSSVGGHLSEKVGPGNGLCDQERRLNKLKETQVVHLRPGYFMENLYWNIDLIKKMGINGSALKADLPMPLIATQDIAAEAVRLLLDLKFAGKSVQELLGQRDITMADVTRVLGKSIGKPDLKYVQFPYEEAEKAMIGMGLSPSVTQAYIEMTRAFNDGIVRPTEKRSAKNTTPTSIEQFAKQFAAVYHG